MRQTLYVAADNDFSHCCSSPTIITALVLSRADLVILSTLFFTDNSAINQKSWVELLWKIFLSKVDNSYLYPEVNF